MLAQRHRVVLASVSDPALTQLRTGGGDATSVYDAAAAERTTALRQGRALGVLGVEVIDADPEHLPAALADHYLLLKSRGPSDAGAPGLSARDRRLVGPLGLGDVAAPPRRWAHRPPKTYVKNAASARMPIPTVPRSAR